MPESSTSLPNGSQKRKFAIRKHTWIFLGGLSKSWKQAIPHHRSCSLLCRSSRLAIKPWIARMTKNTVKIIRINPKPLGIFGIIYLTNRHGILPVYAHVSFWTDLERDFTNHDRSRIFYVTGLIEFLEGRIFLNLHLPKSKMDLPHHSSFKPWQKSIRRQ